MEATTRIMSMAGVLLTVAFGVSACGGGSGASGGSTPVAQAPAGSTPSSTPAQGHLSTAKGLSVYLYAPDTNGKSHCYGGCAKAWPPVPAGTKLAASTGSVVAAKLGTTTRSDGSKQLTYAGHPLYRYVADQKPGQTAGQGLNASGGLWWLVSTQGSAIKTGVTSGSSGGSSTGGSGTGGYSY